MYFYGSRDMLNLYFLQNGLAIVSPSHFVHDFLRKMLIMLYSVKDQISLSNCLYFLRYWAICVLQLFVNQAVTFSFEIKLVSLHDQKVKTKK